MEGQSFKATPAQDNQSELNTAALVECWPGGPIVAGPKECPDRDIWRNSSDTADSALPQLSILDTSALDSNKSA